MSNRSRFFLAATSLALIYLSLESYRGWTFSRPNFDWIRVEMDTFQTEIPAHWTRSDPNLDPRLDRNSILIRSSVSDKDADPYRRELSIRDWGFRANDYDALLAEVRQKNPDQGRVNNVKLSNGLTATTWTSVNSMVEVASSYRIYAFSAPNGHVYTATHDVPQGWKYAWRYNRLFRRILGSMKFKDAPAPAKTK